MLIDSTVAPEFRDYAIERWSEESASYDLALQRVDQLCRQDASCPLRETGVVAAFDTVLAGLLTEPVTAPNGMTFTARDLSDIFFFNLLPVEQRFLRIVVALSQALAGDFTFFLQLQSPPSDADNGIIARSCNDYGTRRTAADYFPIVEAVGDTYPRFIGRLELASFIASCSAWPDADPPIIHNVQHHLDVSILLIGSEFDPEAPLSWTKRMAQALGMAQHVAILSGRWAWAGGTQRCPMYQRRDRGVPVRSALTVRRLHLPCRFARTEDTAKRYTNIRRRCLRWTVGSGAAGHTVMLRDDVCGYAFA